MGGGIVEGAADVGVLAFNNGPVELLVPISAG